MHLYIGAFMDEAMRPGAVLALTLVLAVLAAGCLIDGGGSPISRIPKVILDSVDNSTLVTVLALGEVRYDTICINYTADGVRHDLCAQDRYVMDILVANATFTLNITVIDRLDVYMLNSTVRLDLTDPQDPVFWVQEEGQAKEQDHASPYSVMVEFRWKVGEEE